jgi:hypothetical protein
MNSHRSSLKVGSIAMSSLAIVAGSWMVGCGTSDVGTSPSSKQQVASYLEKEAEQQNSTANKRGRKTGPAPQNIKSKVFKAKAAESE